MGQGGIGPRPPSGPDRRRAGQNRLQTARMPPPAPSLYDRVGGHRQLGVLVRNFYLSLQTDPLLGPIFARHVKSWPAHYATLTEFWALQTGGPAAYGGKLLQAHHALGLRPEFYEVWLAQWRQSCRLHFEAAEAAEMVALAERLARRMPGAGEPDR